MLKFVCRLQGSQSMDSQVQGVFSLKLHTSSQLENTTVQSHIHTQISSTYPVFSDWRGEGDGHRIDEEVHRLPVHRHSKTLFHLFTLLI